MRHSESILVTVSSSEAGFRLDKCLAVHLTDFSRSRLQQLITEGCVSADGGTITDPARKVKPLETYTLSVPEPVALDLKPLDTPLAVVFEDAHLLVIDKPAGLAVHPGPGHADDTLVNALLAHCGGSLSGIGGVMRPGIVHRIDMDTSGLIAVAKHDAAHRHLAAQLADRSMKRQYLAVVKGVPRPPIGRIDAAIARSPANRQKMAVVKNGKDAVTHYRVQEAFARAALVHCRLETGRTHQIRVHMAHIGHPLAGDKLYGRGGGIAFTRQALHAAFLAMIHPETGKPMEFSSPLPEDMRQLLELLGEG